ncbi:MAG: hypothetical protein IKW45_08760 [Clostridia bacterium]|nr:hypothetical protein [Clostridia bacterium]
MKKLFSVKLYRSPLYKIIQALILFYSVCGAGFLSTVILFNLFNGLSLYEMFYEGYSKSLLWKDGFVLIGTYDLIVWLFSIVFYLVISIISFMSLVNNKIVVFDDYIKIRFAPRYLNTVVNIKNITDISLVELEEVSVSQRILNFNFSKKYLYKITTKYKQNIIISCSDEANLNKLKELVKPSYNEEI